VEADNNGVNRVVATDGRATGIQTGLDKYCPICKVKAASEQNYCTVDGAKLSSLRCPECGTPGETSHVYCGYCGCSMKVTDRQLEAAATGIGIAEVPMESSVQAEDSMREALLKRQPSVRPPSANISNRMFK